MSFWNRIFGAKESAKADTAERQTPKPTSTSNPEPPSIHDASRQGDVETVKALLKRYPDLVSAKDKGGQTPLHYAAWMDHAGIVELLLANKAEVNATDGKGRTPLHWAAHEGYKDVAQLLLANKADVDATGEDGWTPLHNASHKGHMEVADLLRQHGGHE